MNGKKDLYYDFNQNYNDVTVKQVYSKDYKSQQRCIISWHNTNQYLDQYLMLP